MPTSPAPLTEDELSAGVAALLEEGGLFTTVPMDIRGVEYDHVFAMSASATLRDLLALKGAEHADKTAIVYGDQRYTSAEVWARAMRFANWLVEEKSVVPGTRVAIAMRNYPEWIMAFLGIVAAGATVVPLNAWWQSDELVDGVERAGVKIIVCDNKRCTHLAPKRQDLGLTLVGAHESVPDADIMFGAIIENEAMSDTAPSVQIDPESDFCLLYTSGSTGKPKGALLTHRSVVNAVLSWSFLLNLATRLRPDAKFTPDDPAVLVCLPLFHVTALHSVVILSWMMGRKNVFLHKWDADEATRLTAAEEVTNFVGVPTMAYELLSKTDGDDLPSLVEITTGGAKRAATHVSAQAESHPGINASSGYGLTETNSLIVHITGQDYLNRPDAAGRAVPPITELKTFSDDGQPLPAGEEGEICVKSPVTFRAYDGDEAATAAAFYPGGWFRTGDIGRVDPDGFLYILDRAKDLIIRAGENVSCLEVENALLSAPGVDEATAFSVPDDRLGEKVGAALYSSNADALDLQAVRDHVAAQLAGFKVPEKLWISPQSLPRGATGKVDKRQIRMIALQHPAQWSC